MDDLRFIDKFKARCFPAVEEDNIPFVQLFPFMQTFVCLCTP